MIAQGKQNTFAEMVSTTPLLLVDFFAEWCGPCKMMKPILEEVKTSVGEKVRIIKVDVDKAAHAASMYQISGVPTLILFKFGKIVWRQSGVVQPTQLKEIIEKNSL